MVESQSACIDYRGGATGDDMVKDVESYILKLGDKYDLYSQNTINYRELINAIGVSIK